jgi:hypothetical protein
MPTYIVKVKTESRFIVDADNPEDALWDFGHEDPSFSKEKFTVYDENGKKLLIDPPKKKRKKDHA